MQERNDTRTRRRAKCASISFSDSTPSSAKSGCSSVGERRLADPAEPERRERDAELTGGQIGVELPVHLGEQTSGQAVGPRDGLDARRPQFDEPEFGRDEKTVQRDEQQCTDKRDNLSQSNALREWKASV